MMRAVAVLLFVTLIGCSNSQSLDEKDISGNEHGAWEQYYMNIIDSANLWDKYNKAKWRFYAAHALDTLYPGLERAGGMLVSELNTPLYHLQLKPTYIDFYFSINKLEGDRYFNLQDPYIGIRSYRNSFIPILDHSYPDTSGHSLATEDTLFRLDEALLIKQIQSLSPNSLSDYIRREAVKRGIIK